MPIRKRYWKCPKCGETEKREPHRRLRDHMELEHGMAWDESKATWTQKVESRLTPTTPP